MGEHVFMESKASVMLRATVYIAECMRDFECSGRSDAIVVIRRLVMNPSRFLEDQGLVPFRCTDSVYLVACFLGLFLL